MADETEETKVDLTLEQDVEEEAPTEAETALTSFLDFIVTQPQAIQEQFKAHEKGLRNALEQERVKAKEGRKAAAKLKKYEEAEAAKVQEGLTALQKAEQARDAALAEAAQLRQTTLTNSRNAVILKAASAFEDPEDALAFVDMSKITQNAKGEWVGIEAEITRITTAKPHLVSKTKKISIGTPDSSKKIQQKPAEVKEPVKEAPLVHL